MTPQSDGGAVAGGLWGDPEYQRCFDFEVVTIDGQPLAHATVLARVSAEVVEGAGFRDSLQAQSHRWHAETESDAHGRGVLCAPKWTEIDLDAWTSEGQWGRVHLYVRERELDEPDRRVRIRAIEPFVVRGRVRRPDGTPIAGAEVTADEARFRRARSGAPDPFLSQALTGRHIVTDAHGRFELAISTLMMLRCMRLTPTAYPFGRPRWPSDPARKSTSIWSWATPFA